MVEEEKVFKISKILCYVVCCIGCVLGIVLMIMAAILLARYSIYLKHFETEFMTIPALCMSFGTIVIIVNVLGFYGAYKEDKILVIGFIVTAAICVVVLIVLVIFLGKYKTKEKIYKDKQEGKMDTPSSTMASLQQSLKCCGRRGPNDYIVIPPSCCENNEYCSNKSDDIYSDGCDEKVHERIKKDLKIIYPVNIVLLVFEVLCCVAGALVLVYIKKLVLSDLSSSDEDEPPAGAADRGGRGRGRRGGAARGGKR